MTDQTKRETLGSRLGFLMLSAGCAVGLGNVWKFPYIVGQNGGGIFVAIYLLFLVILGIPILSMEFSVGRGSRKSPLNMMKALEPEGGKWHLHGCLSIAGCFLLMMFYCVVAGWMLYYFVITATGGLDGLSTSEISGVFSNLTSDWITMAVCTLVIVVTGFVLCSLGIKNGLEKVTKYMMTATFVIMAILVVNSLTLSGSGIGLDFYLRPNPETIQNVGLWNVCLAAMGQAFFTLSIGIGSMAIFGSYVDKRKTLLGEAGFVAAMDTSIAIMAGLIIFPACFTYGVDVGSGPSLIFETLPAVFNSMPYGRLWGSLFFLFLCFASFSTCIALFECQTACVMEKVNIDRKKVCAIVCPIMFVLTLPCIFGFTLWNGFNPLGPGTNILDLEDFIVSYLMLPLGSLAIVLFCTSRYGWGWNKYTEEANTGEGLKVKTWMRAYLTYVLPLIVIVLLITGLIRYL